MNNKTMINGTVICFIKKKRLFSYGLLEATFFVSILVRYTHTGVINKKKPVWLHARKIKYTARYHFCIEKARVIYIFYFRNYDPIEAMELRVENQTKDSGGTIIVATNGSTPAPSLLGAACQGFKIPLDRQLGMKCCIYIIYNYSL